MALDFNPNIDNEDNSKGAKKKPSFDDGRMNRAIVQSEASLVNGSIITSDNTEVVTLNNLLNITQSHIVDDNSCRDVVNTLTEELNKSIQLMSIKEMIEYLKVKIREREFHIDCIFKAYSFIQKSEYAREMFMGSNRKERIIEATDRKRINGLLSMLNNTGEK